jgi:hypothetical protein
MEESIEYVGGRVIVVARVAWVSLVPPEGTSTHLLNITVTVNQQPIKVCHVSPSCSYHKKLTEQ